jgi:hypothetical protein
VAWATAGSPVGLGVKQTDQSLLIEELAHEFSHIFLYCTVECCNTVWSNSYELSRQDHGCILFYVNSFSKSDYSSTVVPVAERAYTSSVVPATWRAYSSSVVLATEWTRI